MFSSHHHTNIRLIDSNNTTGVIFKIEPNLFRVLDQSGTVRSLTPTQIGLRTDSKGAIAVDSDGTEIRVGESMKETGHGVRFPVLVITWI